MKVRKLSVPSVGGSSIITIFAVLCFIVFALLSLSTSKADSALAQKSVDAVQKYYAADIKAEVILSQLRRGEIPDYVYSEGNLYSYQCPIDDKQQISVEVEMDEDSYVIKKWKKEYIGEWKTDNTIKVWGGMEEITE